MNHVVPLSWPAPPRGDARVAYRHEALMRQHFAALLSLSVRSTFRVIATFLEGRRHSLPAVCLAGPVRAAHDLGCITLDLAAEGSLIDAPMRIDCERCLDGLEQLAGLLSDGESSPPWQLDHGLDTLIALLIQLDDAARAQSEAWAKRPLMERSANAVKAPILRRVGGRHQATAQSWERAR